MTGDSNDETNFPHKFLLTNAQVVSCRIAFENGSSVNIRLWKTQLFKMVQLGEFLGKIRGPLLKTGLPLKKNVLKPLTKTILIPLGLNAEASEADVSIQKKIDGLGITTPVISNLSLFK